MGTCLFPKRLSLLQMPHSSHSAEQWLQTEKSYSLPKTDPESITFPVIHFSKSGKETQRHFISNGGTPWFQWSLDPRVGECCGSKQDFCTQVTRAWIWLWFSQLCDFCHDSFFLMFIYFWKRNRARESWGWGGQRGGGQRIQSRL